MPTPENRHLQAEPPNSVPTNGRFETSTEPYAYGGRDVTQPDWLLEATQDDAYLEDGPGMPSAPMPNSIPTGSRRGTSTESYAIGIPDAPRPSWVDGAVQKARARRQARQAASNDPGNAT